MMEFVNKKQWVFCQSRRLVKFKDESIAVCGSGGETFRLDYKLISRHLSSATGEKFQLTNSH